MLYVALLRGININNRRVKMDALRTSFERMGFTNCATFIASGNVIFEATARRSSLEPAIEAALADDLGFEVDTFVRTKAELSMIATGNPFERRKVSPDGTLHVGFLKKAPGQKAVRELRAMETDADSLAVVGRELYWAIAGGMSDSKLGGGRFEDVLGQRTTLRNITSVRKLVAKLDA